MPASTTLPEYPVPEQQPAPDPQAAPIIIKHWKELTYNQIDRVFQVYVQKQIEQVFPHSQFTDPRITLFVNNLTLARDVRELLIQAVKQVPELTAEPALPITL